MLNRYYPHETPGGQAQQFANCSFIRKQSTNFSTVDEPRSQLDNNLKEDMAEMNLNDNPQKFNNQLYRMATHEIGQHCLSYALIKLLF